MEIIGIFNTFIIITSTLSAAEAVNHNTPIVFIHGLHTNSRTWDTAVRFFRSKNYTRIYNFDYGRTTNERIENNSHRLHNYLIQQRIDDEGLVLISHSLGGLIARRMMADHPFIKVAKLITLSTPNYGAKNFIHLCIDSICPNSIIQMKPGSEFLNDLNRRTAHTYTEDRVLTYHIDNDELTPANSAIIRTALYLTTNRDSILLHLFKNSSRIIVPNYIYNNTVTTISAMKNCTIDGQSSSITSSRGKIGGKVCIVNGTTCEINSMICQINDTVGTLSITEHSMSCSVKNSTCTVSNMGEVHGSIKNRVEVLNNVLRFIQGQVEIINAGPHLYDGNCAYFGKHSGNVKWDLPGDSPSSLQMNVLRQETGGYGFFRNEPARKRTKKSLHKGKYYLRFFDPVTTKLTGWSSVEFKDGIIRCVSEIENNENIVLGWEN